MKYIKLFPMLLIMVLYILLYSVPALAISSPDTITLWNVWAYRNCKETGDQLYLVDFTVDYASNPTEDLSEAYLCRLMNGSTELISVSPYAYYDDGYERGLIAMYFSASDAPTWEGSYTVELAGNPLLSWSGTVPSTSTSTFTVWQDNDIGTTRQLVSDRILYMADKLDGTWGASYDLLEVTATGTYLSENGSAYFAGVLADVRTIAPYAFADRTIDLDIDDQDYNQSYAGDLETDITDSPFDLTDLGTAFSMSRGTITALLYYLAVIAFAIIASRELGTYKPAMLIVLFSNIPAPFIGVPLIIPVMVGFISIVMIGYVLFYRPSGA